MRKAGKLGGRKGSNDEARQGRKGEGWKGEG